VSAPAAPQDPAEFAYLAQFGRGEVESYRRALEQRGVQALVLPLRECDGPS
jgi:hypothetical protein